MAGASGVAAFGVLVGLAVVVRLLTEDATRHILQVALAAEADRLMAEAGPMRTALLTAVNQELRPSPASADAAVSCLRSPGVQLTAEHHDQLLATVEESLDQLARVAASLLDMSRQQAHGVDGYACSGLVRDPRDGISAGSSHISPSYIETRGRFYEAGSA
jgi:two-component system sensor histidine kinase KdpD